VRDPRELQVESDLIRRLRAGDDLAAAELVRAYRPRVYQMACRYLKNAEDAEELTQDVFVKAVAKIDAFRGDAALSSWLFRITFNAAMSRLRQVRAARTVGLGDDAPVDADVPEVADWSGMADEALLRRQLRHRLVNALRRLPTIYRVPVILRDLKGLTTEEASRLLRLNAPTLKSRLHRGRLLLRRELADFADGLALHRVAPVVQGA
jgi:RNA polymerase sigma-70 factor (ECF subfamily)